MKSVTILLTTYSDWLSNLYYYICGKGYTHASISLDSGSTYYSFNYKGFCKETPYTHRRRGTKKSMSYELIVSDSAYQKMQDRIMDFEARQQNFCYTRLGVFFCLMGIPLHWKHHYFCSRFVAEVLFDSGAMSLLKDSALYLPNDFRCELDGSSQVRRIELNPI